MLRSCLNNLGLEFLWIFPRQSGKDEAVAQLLAQLLTIYQKKEKGIIHAYPSTNQLDIGSSRLEKRLDVPILRSLQGSPHRRARPIRVVNGTTQCAFFSGHPLAKAEGATANLLLVINEAQDQNPTIVDRRFTPMRSSTNATALYVGTVRTSSDYLWSKKKELEEKQARDGIRRVFIISPEQVGESNPAYWKFVQARVAEKGRNHPVIKTEYFNEPVDAADRLFPARRIALMRGGYPRIRSPQAGEIYVGVIDVGGQDEAASSGFSSLDNPGRDYTTCSIARCVVGGELGPRYEVVDLFADQGSRHFQDVPGKPSLFSRLLAYLNHWRVLAVVVDKTGVGQGLTDALIKSYSGFVKGFDFSGESKPWLGNEFLSLVETGRFKYFAGEDEDGSDGWWFFTQALWCGYELREDRPIERSMKWGVAESARVDLHGKSVPVHDDYLLSAALLAEVDRLVKIKQIFLSTGESAVIRPAYLDSDRGGWS